MFSQTHSAPGFRPILGSMQANTARQKGTWVTPCPTETVLQTRLVSGELYEQRVAAPRQS